MESIQVKDSCSLREGICNRDGGDKDPGNASFPFNRNPVMAKKNYGTGTGLAERMRSITEAAPYYGSGPHIERRVV
jgi:hypothetical protein